MSTAAQSGRPARAGTEPARLALPRPRIFRGRDGAGDPPVLAGRLPRERHRRARATGTRSTISARACIVIRGDDGAVARLLQRLPPPRLALVDGARRLREAADLPLSRLDLRLDGRLIGVPHKADYPGLDTAELGLVPVELEQLARLPVRPARGRRPVGRRDDGALRGRDRALPLRGAARRSAGSRCGRARSTGRTSPTIIRTGSTSTSPIPA